MTTTTTMASAMTMAGAVAASSVGAGASGGGCGHVGTVATMGTSGGAAAATLNSACARCLAFVNKVDQQWRPATSAPAPDFAALRRSVEAVQQRVTKLTSDRSSPSLFSPSPSNALWSTLAHAYYTIAVALYNAKRYAPCTQVIASAMAIYRAMRADEKFTQCALLKCRVLVSEACSSTHAAAAASAASSSSSPSPPTLVSLQRADEATAPAFLALDEFTHVRDSASTSTTPAPSSRSPTPTPSPPPSSSSPLPSPPSSKAATSRAHACITAHYLRGALHLKRMLHAWSHHRLDARHANSAPTAAIRAARPLFSAAQDDDDDDDCNDSNLASPQHLVAPPHRSSPTNPIACFRVHARACLHAWQSTLRTVDDDALVHPLPSDLYALLVHMRSSLHLLTDLAQWFDWPALRLHTCHLLLHLHTILQRSASSADDVATAAWHTARAHATLSALALESHSSALAASHCQHAARLLLLETPPTCISERLCTHLRVIAAGSAEASADRSVPPRPLHDPASRPRQLWLFLYTCASIVVTTHRMRTVSTNDARSLLLDVTDAFDEPPRADSSSTTSRSVDAHFALALVHQLCARVVLAPHEPAHARDTPAALDHSRTAYKLAAKLAITLRTIQTPTAPPPSAAPTQPSAASTGSSSSTITTAPRTLARSQSVLTKGAVTPSSSSSSSSHHAASSITVHGGATQVTDVVSRTVHDLLTSTLHTSTIFASSAGLRAFALRDDSSLVSALALASHLLDSALLLHKAHLSLDQLRWSQHFIRVAQQLVTCATPLSLACLRVHCALARQSCALGSTEDHLVSHAGRQQQHRSHSTTTSADDLRTALIEIATSDVDDVDSVAFESCIGATAPSRPTAYSPIRDGTFDEVRSIASHRLRAKAWFALATIDRHLRRWRTAAEAYAASADAYTRAHTEARRVWSSAQQQKRQTLDPSANLDDDGSHVCGRIMLARELAVACTLQDARRSVDEDDATQTSRIVTLQRAFDAATCRGATSDALACCTMLAHVQQRLAPSSSPTSMAACNEVFRRTCSMLTPAGMSAHEIRSTCTEAALSFGIVDPLRTAFAIDFATGIKYHQREWLERAKRERRAHKASRKASRTCSDQRGPFHRVLEMPFDDAFDVFRTSYARGAASTTVPSTWTLVTLALSTDRRSMLVSRIEAVSGSSATPAPSTPLVFRIPLGDDGDEAEEEHDVDRGGVGNMACDDMDMTEVVDDEQAVSAGANDTASSSSSSNVGSIDEPMCASPPRTPPRTPLRTPPRTPLRAAMNTSPSTTAQTPATQVMDTFPDAAINASSPTRKRQRSPAAAAHGSPRTPLTRSSPATIKLDDPMSAATGAFATRRPIVRAIARVQTQPRPTRARSCIMMPGATSQMPVPSTPILPRFALHDSARTRPRSCSPASSSFAIAPTAHAATSSTLSNTCVVDGRASLAYFRSLIDESSALSSASEAILRSARGQPPPPAGASTATTAATPSASPTLSSSTDASAHAVKLDWWRKRFDLDRRMRAAIDSIEQSWLGPWRAALLGQLADGADKEMSSLSSLSSSSLSETLGRSTQSSAKLRLDEHCRVIANELEQCARRHAAHARTGLASCSAACAAWHSPIFSRALHNVDDDDDEQRSVQRVVESVLAYVRVLFRGLAVDDVQTLGALRVESMRSATLWLLGWSHQMHASAQYVDRLVARLPGELRTSLAALEAVIEHEHGAWRAWLRECGGGGGGGSCNSSSGAHTALRHHPLVAIVAKEVHVVPWEHMSIVREHNQLITRMPSWTFVLAQLPPFRATERIGPTPCRMGAAASDPRSIGNNVSSTAANSDDTLVARDSHDERLLHLDAHGTLHGLHATSTYHVVNPSGDLVATQGRFADLGARLRPHLQHGVVGAAPTRDQFVHGLQHHDVFVYCGHNAGEQYWPSEEEDEVKEDGIARDHSDDDHDDDVTVSGRRRHHHHHLARTTGASLLMGCSSAAFRGNAECEWHPECPVWRYLGDGSPAVIGTLWDVTDGEIDRFACAALSALLLASPQSSPQCADENDSSSSCARRKHDEHVMLLNLVHRSRRACKLPSLMGAAVVHFGLPVVFAK